MLSFVFCIKGNNMKEYEISLVFYLSQFVFYAILFFFKAYGAIMACILFTGFYLLVVCNKKYKHMKDFIEIFF
jgi:hypothetical protein